MRSSYKFYRITYSVIALLTLGVVLLYHFTMESIWLWQVVLAEKIIAIVGMVSGGVVMLLFTRRFFFDLSGAHVFRKKHSQQGLIETDLYKHVRHPLYAATLLLVWSIFLWQPMLNNFLSCICISIYTVIGIRFEEKKLVNEFGKSYEEYRSKTPMLVPRLF